MKKKPRKSDVDPDGYLLLPGVTHPQGRQRAFIDAMRAMVRAMIEISGQPMFAYAIDKTDRIMTTENLHLLSPAERAEWNAACDEFDAISPEEQQTWIEKVVSTYPRIDQLPDPESYNDIN